MFNLFKKRKKISDGIKIKGHIHATIIDTDGKTVLKEIDIDNIITYVGKAAVAGLMGNVGGISSFGWLALGSSNTAAAATQTALGTELATNGLSRVASTNTRITTAQTNDTLQMAGSWTATGAGGTIQEVGFFNAASVGIMGGRQVLSLLTLTAGQTILIAYTVQFL